MRGKCGRIHFMIMALYMLRQKITPKLLVYVGLNVFCYLICFSALHIVKVPLHNISFGDILFDS